MTRIGWAAVLVVAFGVGGCSAPVDDDLEFRVEQVAIGQYASVAGPPVGMNGFAEVARGAVLTPFRWNNGNLVKADDGTQIRGSCGTIMISPSYALTAAHCVDATDVPNPATNPLKMEMYAPGAALPSGYTNAMTLSTNGGWDDFQHGSLGAAQGYVKETFDCHVVVRCGDDWGNYNCAPLDPDADVALLKCDGNPGNKYGHVDVADDDLDNVPVFMPWAHEVYVINGTEGDDLWWDHYTAYPGTGASNAKNNIHYFGDGRNLLVPLRSKPMPGATQNVKFNHFPTPPNERYRYTDLAGCHGTSGSPVLQPDPNTGMWEVLGPAITGSSAANLDDRLCMDPASTNAASPYLAYGALRFTKHAVDQVNDCNELTQGKGLVFLTWCWFRSMQWIEFNPFPEIWPCLTCPPYSRLRVVNEWMAVIRDEEAVELPLALRGGAPSRIALLATSMTGADNALTLVDDAGEDLLASGVPAEGFTVMSAALDEPLGGSALALAARGSVGITQVQVASSEVANSFDEAVARFGAGLLPLEGGGETAVVPMRFGPDGLGGFAALLDRGERMVLTREALVAGRSWTAVFDVAGEAALQCGFILEDGEEIVHECAVEDGRVHAEFDVIDAQPIAFFVDAVDAEGISAIDNVLLVDRPG